jgi:hypothetical protein
MSRRRGKEERERGRGGIENAIQITVEKKDLYHYPRVSPIPYSIPARMEEQVRKKSAPGKHFSSSFLRNFEISWWGALFGFRFSTT